MISIPKRRAIVASGMGLAVGIGAVIAFSAVTGANDGLRVDGPSSPTEFPRNESGLTYGSALDATSPENEPDLIEAIGIDGTSGYVMKKDLEEPTPSNPEEAARLKRTLRTIPLYDVEGKKVIGEFEIDPGLPATSESSE